MEPLPDRTPDIDYPVRWGYRLIGSDPEAVRAAVREVLGDHEHRLTQSNTSSRGRYHAFAVELVVEDEAQRLRLFEAFKAHAAIVYVL